MPLSDPELRRRGQNLMVIGLVLILLTLLSIPLVLIQPDPIPQLISSLIGLALLIAIMVLTRSGRVDQATIGLIIVLVGSFALIPFGTGQIGLVPVFAVVAVVTAAVVGRVSHVVLSVLASVAGSIGQWLALAGQAQDSPGPGEVVVVGVLLTVACGVIAGIGTRSVQHAIALATAAQARAEELARRLGETNQALELRVIERTAALQAALAESEQRQRALSAALSENERQRREIQALSVPILAVHDDMLIMPLIGVLDSQRLALAQQRALESLEQSRARSLLVDITGVPYLDQEGANGLIALARSARLLGARLILIGVSPEVAQTIVGLGISLTDIKIARDLRAAVQERLFGQSRQS
ncbi:STAS domain-containing protein [Chloroflexus sp.]|uniref:STAS domain-containing protein n=1 Tax=Chloroflexus sp. TaxID=1904827 RepID=UPI002628CCB7|nr:STAS domain-containing protein [uncultured Chloroflexus sp.]